MSVSPIDAVIASNLDQFRKPGVLSVRAGYQTVGGWPTRKPAIVVTVEHKTDAVPQADRLPEKVDGYSVDVREASPLKRFELTSPGSYETALPSIPPEQRVAAFADELRLQPIAEEQKLVAALAAKPQLDYTGPEGFDLTAVEDEFTITCHASPDAGWPTLSAFLAGTADRLTVGLYDFTSAHILAALNAALNGKKLDLVLDHPSKNPTADQTDEETQSSLTGQLGENLRFAWALEGSDPLAAVLIFPNAYHIKVAVRDGDTFWLSSGNWNNSNQPDIDPVNKPEDAAAAAKADRDWHVVVQHPGLARTFAAYIENDLSVASAHQVTGPPEAAFAAAVLAEEMMLAAAELETKTFAQFFAPQVFTGHMRVQPLLTPDPGVYAGAVLDLVTGAQQSLYIQTQYAHPSTRPEDQAFTDLLNAVIARQQAGVDVRMIFSQWETSPYLEKLQAAGFDLSQVRIQRGVHNKGIVQDGKIVLISSQNWSADGVLRNRDAGVIIEYEPIARYFQQIFMHDWTNLARQQALDG